MRRARRGAQVLELAFVAPVLVGLLAGVIELAFLVADSGRVAAVAHEAAEVGAAVVEGRTVTGDPPVAAAEAHARAALADAGLACDAGCTVAATWVEDPVTGFASVRVALSVPRPPLTHLGYGATVLRAEATAVSVQQD